MDTTTRPTFATTACNRTGQVSRYRVKFQITRNGESVIRDFGAVAQMQGTGRGHGSGNWIAYGTTGEFRGVAGSRTEAARLLRPKG